MTELNWTIQSVEFSRPEYWSGEPFPSPGDLPNPGIDPRSPTLQVVSLPAEPQGKPKEYWSEWPIASPADLSDPGIELGSPALQADSLPTELPRKPTLVVNYVQVLPYWTDYSLWVSTFVKKLCKHMYGKDNNLGRKRGMKEGICIFL